MRIVRGGHVAAMLPRWLLPVLLCGIGGLGAGCAVEPALGPAEATPARTGASAGATHTLAGAPLPADWTAPRPDTPAGLALPLEEWCALLNDGVDASAVGLTFGLQVVALFPEHRLALFAGPHVELSALQADPRIRVVQTNDPVVLTQPVDLLMGFHQGDWSDGAAVDQDALACLHLARVHARCRGEGVRVATLDTGVDLDHPFMVGRVDVIDAPLLGSPQEIADGLDSDGDGLVDEGFGHGTHVAGIVATVAPAATIVPFRVLDDDGVGTAFRLAVGLAMAEDAHVSVVNLSLILSGDAPVISSLIAKLRTEGIAVVAAAGNAGGAVAFPASDPNAVSIGACDSAQQLAAFSAVGASLAAPGVAVLSCYPGGGSARATGTSMSCAVASGALALLASASGDPWATRTAEALLFASAQPLTPQGAVVYGRVAPLAAIQQFGGPEPNLHVAQRQ